MSMSSKLCAQVALAAFVAAGIAEHAPCQKAPDTELATARDKYGSDKEGDCTAATEICVKKNNVAAVELMLETLRLGADRRDFLPSGHYRDIVWGGLARITDPYARQRVEMELKTNRESAWVRQWCAELLGEYGVNEFGETLLKALGDKDIDVQRAATRALGKVRFGAAAKTLLARIGDKDMYLREYAIESLARIDPAVHKPLFVKSLKDRDGGVRCALLGAAGEIYPSEAEGWSVAALDDKDWRPRMQAVDNLGGIKTKSAVDALIKALGDGRPAVGARALHRLQELTGQKHTRKEVWEAWWKDHRESFEFPDGASKADLAADGTTVAYHGIQLVSDHVAFLIDKSDDMNQNLAATKSSKAEAAFKELDSVLAKLQGRLVFNIYTYAEDVAVFEDKGPVELTAKTKEKALRFVELAPIGKSKNIWKLLETVIVDPELDTAYMLSSGEPDIGEYVHWNRVTWHLKELNRFQKVVVHTIAYSNSEWYRDQLSKIAEVTGGEFKWSE